MSLVEIIRPVYPGLFIFPEMMCETCFVKTDVRCSLKAACQLRFVKKRPYRLRLSVLQAILYFR
ncbi:hypothetical protein CWM63_27395 [Klebsiella sp. F-Nf9]|nr:hypothetical protein CWM63_27395 [Klebsiella sp. F-Nf9]PKJ69901.1 hypothetical protein CW267_14765 [Klebsiella sp. X1-16S-Nf21]